MPLLEELVRSKGVLQTNIHTKYLVQGHYVSIRIAYEVNCLKTEKSHGWCFQMGLLYTNITNVKKRTRKNIKTQTKDFLIPKMHVCRDSVLVKFDPLQIKGPKTFPACVCKPMGASVIVFLLLCSVIAGLIMRINV